MEELKYVFKSVFPDVNDETKIFYEGEIDGKKMLFEHSGSDFLLWFTNSFRYDKEKNILIELDSARDKYNIINKIQNTKMTKEEVLERLEKRAKQLEFSIEMSTKTIGEIILLNDGRDHKVAISELARGVTENREERIALLGILDGEYNIQVMRGLKLPEEYIQALLSDEMKKTEEETDEKPDGVVDQIGGYDIYELIGERLFIIKFPEEFGIISSYVISYSVVSRNILYIEVRNNITCPLLKLEKLRKEMNNTQIYGEITISTLDPTGNILYDTVYTINGMKPIITSGGDYSSNEPQKITLRFEFSDYDLIDRRNAATA